MIPDYLIEFIQNDPKFVPEIYCNTLEDAFFDIHKNNVEKEETKENSSMILSNKFMLKNLD